MSVRSFLALDSVMFASGAGLTNRTQGGLSDRSPSKFDGAGWNAGTVAVAYSGAGVDGACGATGAM